MSLATAELPADPAALRAFALACQGELKAAQTAVQLKALEIEKLRFQIAKLRRMQFGRSSERITRQIEQLELQLEELETSEAEDVARAEVDDPEAPARARAKPKRKPLPDHLPRQEVLHQPLGDGACVCPACGGGMGKLGEDVTEVLDYLPGHFQVIRHMRPKYACRACDAITQAPAPAMPTPRGRATPAMLAHLLVSKYCDHLPLYRQSEIYAREGLDLDRSTLCDWVGQAAWLLDPIVAGIRAHVFAAEKIHGDDTTVPVLSPGLGRTKTGRLWAYVRDDRPFCGEAPPAVAYFYSPDRTSAHRAAHLAGFTGLLQADAYARFEKLYGPARSKPGPITEVACWAHTRRGFFNDWEQHKSPTAKQALDRIAAIYAIEARAAFAPIAERIEPRRELAPLLDDFFAWADATVAKLSAKVNLAEAFRYALNRREALSRFVTDGRLEIDNNIAENAMRCIALGRKSYLFAGSDSGEERTASVYTIVRTAKLNSLNPETYLRDTLARIAEGHPISRINELMPFCICNRQSFKSEVARMNFATLVIATLLTTPLHAAPSAWLKSEIAGMHEITGPFVQEDYGFSVEPPANAFEYVTNGGNANHGVRMILGEHREIDVSPEYTDAELGNTEPCKRHQFPWERTSSREAGTILLGTQTACLVTFTDNNAVWSVIQATDQDCGQGIMYTLVLTTTREALQTDLVSLHQVASTFKKIPIYP